MLLRLTAGGLWRDDCLAVQWINCCRGGAEPELMGPMGVLEFAGGHWFYAPHVPDVHDVEGDRILRLDRAFAASVPAIGNMTVFLAYVQPEVW